MPWGKDQTIQPAADQAASASSGLPSWGRNDQTVSVKPDGHIPLLDVMRAPSLGDVVGASLYNNRDIDAGKAAGADLGQSIGASLNAPELRAIDAPEAAGRGFVSGGGKLLEAIGNVQNLTNPGLTLLGTVAGRPDLVPGNVAARFGREAQATEAINPQTEYLAGAVPKASFMLGEQVPTLAGAIATGGGASLEGLVPSVVKAVPVLGKFATNIAAGAPTAAALTGEQAFTTPDMSLGDLAKSGALNLAMAGVPPALGSNPLVRTGTGAAIGGGLAAGTNYLEGKPQDTAQTLVGAITGAALAGGHEPAAPLDPYLARYEANIPEAPAGPLTLPAPDLGSAVPGGEPVAPVAPVAPSAATPFDAKAATQAFHADPHAALASLDPATLQQLASDVGIDAKAGETPAALAQRIAAQPKDFLSNDVLPEYLATAQDAHSAAAPIANANVPPESSAPGLGDLARSLSPSTTVPVDTQGTAYTPEQGSKTLADAIQAQAGATTRALPPAVTTVDSAGNALTSADTNRQLAQDREHVQAGIEAAKARRELGITPDIERTQGPRWQQLAENADDLRAMQDYRDAEDGEIVGQRTDDSPPWWLAGHAEHDAFSQDVNELAQQREALSQPERQQASDVLAQHGIAPEDHDEAMGFAQLIERAIDAGAAPRQIMDAGLEPDNASRARALWALTNRLEGGRNAEGSAVQQAGAAAGVAPNSRPAAAGAPEPRLLAGTAEDRQASEDLPAERARSRPERVAAEGPKTDEHTGLPLNDDGTVTVYHHTSPEKAADIRRTGQLKSAGEPDVYVTTRKEADTGYGDEAVPVRVKPESLELDDEFPNGRKDFRIHAGKPGGSVPVKLGEGVKDSSNFGELQRIVPPNQRRPDWSPAVEGRAITALDELVQRYGGSTLADTIRDDLREHTTAQLIGQKVGSPEDLAALASVYRNPAFETMRYVYTAKDGTILGETAVSSRMPSSAVAFPTDQHGYDNGTQWIMASAPEGTHGLWMIHNHPSGNPKPSRADLDYTGSMGIKLGDIAGAPRLLGHVVLDHDTFGHIDSLGDFQGVKGVPGKAGTADPLRRYAGDTSMFALPVTAPEFAAVTGKRIAAATPENSSAVVLMDASGRAVSVHTFPNDFLTSPRGAAMVSRMGGKRGAAGIGIVTSRENFIANHQAFQKAATRGLLRDAIVVDPRGLALNIGSTPAFPKEVRRNFGQQSAATKRRSDAGVQVHEEAPPISLQAVRRALEARGVSPEVIAGMSREQLRAEQANLRARSAPSPEQVAAEPAITGIKNATKEEERALKGKAAVEHDLAQTNPDQYARAKAIFDADPHAGQVLAARVVADKKAITPEESILLSLDAMRIINARQQAYETAQKAISNGDEATKLAALSLVRQLDGQMEANDIAARYSGTRAGQALQARKVMIQQDYSMARMVLRAKVAKGADLTGAERSRIEQLSAEIDKRSKALDAREAKLRAMEAEAAPVQKKTAAKAKFNDLVAQLKAISEKDHLKPGCVI
jgi:hypothetical protein